MPTFFLAPTANFVQTTINGAITDIAVTITLASTANLPSPGYIVIDRVDSSGISTPSAREVVAYTGISGNNLTGCSRGADGSTARSHSDGAVVETTPTIGLWNNLVTIVSTGFTSDGYLKAINSPVSIARAELTQAVIPSIASIAQIHSTNVFASGITITGNLNVSGASVVGAFPLHPTFSFIGALSGPTTTIQTPVPMPYAGSFRYFSLITRTVASGASAIVDININGTSIFDAGTRPSIAGGGTFVSTASIAVKAFAKGARLSWDYDTTGGLITDMVVQGES